MTIYVEVRFLKTSESSENYLETILLLSRRLPVVRSVDIANEMDFKKSSISVAMKHLREKKLIIVDNSGFIFLTDEGREIAERTYEKHEFVSNWLHSIGVPEDIAVEDACRIEHVLSPESFEALKKYVAAHPAD